MPSDYLIAMLDTWRGLAGVHPRPSAQNARVAACHRPTVLDLLRSHAAGNGDDGIVPVAVCHRTERTTRAASYRTGMCEGVCADWGGVLNVAPHENGG